MNEKKEKLGTSDPAGRINWKEVHKRLEKAEKATEKGFAVTAKERKKILRERARQISREPEREEIREYLEVTEFQLAYEKYAIESEYIREVHSLKDFTPIPCTPAFVFGIINVRGKIISVIDFKKFFDLPEKGLPDFNKVIILQSWENEFGILADSIIGTRSIPINKIQPSLPTLTGVREEYLKGVFEDRIVVLDAQRILSDKKIIVHEKVGT